MYLQGQGTRRSTTVGQAGFALAALLVAIAVLSVMLIVALPTWRHLAQREKEAELIFRGEQYARAIGLYQRKLAGALPPSIDILVEQKFLRKKYKDPITGEDFVPVYANAQAGLAGTSQSSTPAAFRGNVNAQPPASVPAQGPGRGEGRGSSTFGAGIAGGNGIVGVMSKSKAESIRLYNGRNRYDQWVFTYISAQPAMAAPPGQRGRGPVVQPAPGLPPPPGRGRGGQ